MHTSKEVRFLYSRVKKVVSNVCCFICCDVNKNTWLLEQTFSKEDINIIC